MCRPPIGAQEIDEVPAAPVLEQLVAVTRPGFIYLRLGKTVQIRKQHLYITEINHNSITTIVRKA